MKSSPGFYPAGSKLPSERDLSEKYRISRNTVRLTLEELEAAGAIRRRPRSGAVVTADAPAILRAAPAAQAELSAALILPPDQISNPVVQAIFTVFCKYCSEKVRISVVFIDQLASEDFRSLRADMAILFAVPEAAVRRRLAQRIGRLILLNATAGDCDYIAPDNRLAGRLIAEHLLECGHRSIGGVTFDDRDPGSDFRQRLDGCAEVFDAAGAGAAPDPDFRVEIQRRQIPAQIGRTDGESGTFRADRRLRRDRRRTLRRRVRRRETGSGRRQHRGVRRPVLHAVHASGADHGEIPGGSHRHPPRRRHR